MSATKALSVLTSLLVAGAVAVIFTQHRSQTALRRENEFLRQRLAELASENDTLSNRLARVADRSESEAGPPTSASDTSAASKSLQDVSHTNLISRLMHGEDLPALPADQLKGYLEENHRSAASLLSAYHASHDAALLDEAMQKFPNDPEVAFQAVFKKDASPAEKRQWLDAFKKAAPENSLPVYLSTLDYFKSGQTDLAVQELTTLPSGQRYNDYTADRIQNYEEAYRAAGYSETDAKMAATWGVTLPQLSQMKPLAQEIVALASTYRQAGDENSAQTALEMAMNVGQQLDPSSGNSTPLITELVGIAVQRIVLNAMDPASPYGDGTVQQQLDQLTQRRTSIQQMVKQSDPFREQMTPADWLTYNERTRSFGEENAIAWLVNKYAPNR